MVWIELELISCAKWKEGESAVRHRCSHRHVSSSRTSWELMGGSAGDRLQACFLLSLFQSVKATSALPHRHGEKREGAEKWSWMERDKDRKIKKEGQESVSPGEKCDVAQWEERDRKKKENRFASHSEWLEESHGGSLEDIWPQFVSCCLTWTFFD